MRRPLTVFFLTIAMSIAAAAQTVEPTRAAQADSLVEQVMQFPVGFSLGFWDQLGRLLGDSVAGAVARRLRLAELLNSDTAIRVLGLLESAFQEPSFIRADEDKKPGVTLLLLDHLANFSPDAAVRESATQLIGKLTLAAVAQK